MLQVNHVAVKSDSANTTYIRGGLRATSFSNYQA